MREHTPTGGLAELRDGLGRTILSHPHHPKAPFRDRAASGPAAPTRLKAGIQSGAVLGKRGNEVRASRARRFAADLAPTINGIQKAGTTSLRGIADELNRRGVLTASGNGKWISSMVWRLLDRLKA